MGSVGGAERPVFVFRPGREGQRVDAAPVQLGLPLGTLDQGEARVYQLVFGFLPPSKNVYDGWPASWQSGCKKKWIRCVREQLDANLVPRGVPKIGLSAQLVFPTPNRRDPQNYAQTLWHFVPDALVICGVVRDDSAGHIDFGPSQLGVRFAVDDRNMDKRFRQRTVIALTMLVPPGTPAL